MGKITLARKCAYLLVIFTFLNTFSGNSFILNNDEFFSEPGEICYLFNEAPKLEDYQKVGIFSSYSSYGENYIKAAGISISGTETNVLCSGESNGAIDITASAGVSPYTYSWSGPGTFSSASEDINNLGTGTYNVTVTDINNATASSTFIINEPTPLQISSPTSTDVSCNGQSDGTVTAGSVSGGTTPYQYQLDSGAFGNSNSFSGLSAGNHTITVQDRNGCKISQSATITQPAVLTMQVATATPVSCNGQSDGTITAGAVSGGNSNYQYSLDGTTFQTSNSFTGLDAKNYTITVKDDKGCSANFNIVVTQPAVLTMQAAIATPVSCNGQSDGTITAGAVSGGNSNYQYSIDGTSFQTSNSFTGLAAKTYTVTVKDDKGCSATSNIEVTQPAILTMQAATATPVTCNGQSDGTITAGAVSGGNPNYQYSLDGTTVQTSNSFSGLSAGTYTVTVKDDKGCTATFSVQVTQPDPLIMANDVSFTPVSCNGSNDGTLTVGTVSGGYGNYSYSIDGINFDTAKTFSSLKAGNYTIYTKDSKACTLETAVLITQPDELTVSAPSYKPVSCFGGADGTIMAGKPAGGNGNYVYSIDNINFSSSNTFSNLKVGDYTIFIKDAKGCSVQSFINVAEPAQLKATINSTNVSCFGGNDGTISLTNPSGGTSGLEFRINSGFWQSSPVFANLSAGTYSVSLRDAGTPTCEVILDAAFQLAQPSAPISGTISYTRPSAYQTPTATASVSPTGGTPGYTYAWRLKGDTAILQTTKTATNLNAGIYEVTVKDSKGCVKLFSVEIIDALEAIIVPVSICMGDQNTIRTSYFEVEFGSAHGGVPPYSYAWDFGATSVNQYRPGTGSHQVNYTVTGNKTITLTVTDAEGKIYIATEQQYVGLCYEPCGKSENITFNPDNVYIGTIDGTPINTVAIGTCNNNVPKYLFLKVDKAANIYNPYTELSYGISDGLISTNSEHYFTKGCKEDDEIDTAHSSKPGKVGGFIRLTTNAIAYNCGNNFSVDSFYLTWTNVDKKLCGQSNNAFCYSTNEPIVVPTVLKAEATATSINCNGGTTGIITTKASGGFAPYYYNLTGLGTPYQNSNKFNNLAAGNYTVYVKDIRGQKTTAKVTITQPQNPISLSTQVTQPVCFGEKGSAIVTATGGTPANGNTYQYMWNDFAEQTTAQATGLDAGTFTVTVIDANGCQKTAEVIINAPAKLTQAIAGENQTFKCGFNSAILAANAYDNSKEIGTWSVVSGVGGNIAELSNPTTSFTGVPGTYTLQWKITDLNENCGSTSTVTVTFLDDCSQLDFDGVDDYVIVGDNYGLNSGSYTLETWVKPKSIDGIRTILSKRNSRNLAEGGYDLIINSGAPTFRIGTASISTSSKLSTDRWYHIAVINDAGTLSLYVDGIKVGNKSFSNPGDITEPFLIGAMYNPNTPEIPANYFHGWIEEMRIWKRALNEEQLHFLMNQRVKLASNPVRGSVLPIDVPGAIPYSELSGYYQLLSSEVTSGITKDLAQNPIDAYLKNIETDQENTAPLPYISNNNGVWRDVTMWLHPDVWDAPNSQGINGENIDWNIAVINHDITSGGNDITLLGLLSKGQELSIFNPNEAEDEKNSGQGLTITHYFDLDGELDLIGESQLVQTEGSILDQNSSGFMERDQQGTASSYNYNYWSSPVVPPSNNLNSTYTVAGVIQDGTSSSSPQPISYGDGYRHADGVMSKPIKLSNWWIYKFKGDSNQYSQWKQIGSTGTLNVGEGYTMKGSSGYAAIAERQNYVFTGRPNNGTISLSVGTGQNYLLGNPYASAIDVNEFIKDNLKDVNGGRGANNVFNGAIYFWDHFSGHTHYLPYYVGGYATRNLIDAVPAIATDERINNTEEKSTKVPGRFIPVAQGFFINTSLDPKFSSGISIQGGSILFKNSQRSFVREERGQYSNSQFLRPETNTKESTTTDDRAKIRLDYRSPMGYNRQILVGVDENTTNGFDLGYDAPLNDDNQEDMFWMIGTQKFVIQGVSNFDPVQVLPLGIKTSEKGEISIKINALENIPDEMEIYLKDNATNIYHNLRESEFKSTPEVGELVNRFEIVFQDKSSTDETEQEESSTDEDENTNTETDTETPDSEETAAEKPGQENENENEEGNPTQDFSKGEVDIIYVANDHELALWNPKLKKVQRIEIYNFNGQRVQTISAVPLFKESRFPVSNFAQAVYVIKVYCEDKIIIKNIIVK